MFKIDIRQGHIVQHQMKKEVAKLPARELLLEKSAGAIAEAGEGIGAFNLKDSWWNGRIDVREAIKNAQLYKKDYERTLPEKLSPEAENAMWKRAKQLKDEFTVGMLSREELHPVKQFTDNGTIKCVVNEEAMRNTRSAEREYAWQKVNEPKIREFKNLMRHLDPDNPNAGDVERFRPKGKMNV